MEMCGLDTSVYWINPSGDFYDPSKAAMPNVLYKKSGKYFGTLSPSNNINDDNTTIGSNNDVDNSLNDVTDKDNDLAGAGEAAAVVGAPLALAALGFRRRIRGKHVKIK